MTWYTSAESTTRHPTPASFDRAQDRLSGEGSKKGTHPGLRPPLPRGEQNIPSLEGCRVAAGWVLPRFLRDRRAAGTALTAALFTLMSLAGIAFASDHVWLVYQRDLLKAATDAASIAATRALHALDPNLEEEKTKENLHPIAERYVLANLPEGYRDQIESQEATLTVTVDPNRKAGTVDVSATADLGGTIFGSWLWGTVGGTTTVESKTERTESIAEVVLAIDITGSMTQGVTGSSDPPEPHMTRMAVVKQAAQDLVDVLTANSDSVAIGLVPWYYRVKFDSATRQRWEDNSWAVYPTRRYYPHPYVDRKRDVDYYDPHQVTSEGEWHNLPAKPEVWKGCPDQRRASGQNPPGLSIALPKAEPITMGFYSPTLPYLSGAYDLDAISFKCHDTSSLPELEYYENNEEYKQFGCYEEGKPKTLKPQHDCLDDMPAIIPLTTDSATIKQAITNLKVADLKRLKWANESRPDTYSLSATTYSTLGIVWGHRLLAPTWRPIWGDPVHPADLNKSTIKALVLLTDGQDTHHEKTEEHRQQACKAAKASGLKVFVITATKRGAVPTTNQTKLETSLTQCSSQADDPSGQYVFINDASKANLESAFQQIGQQILRFRRVL